MLTGTVVCGSGYLDMSSRKHRVTPSRTVHKAVTIMLLDLSHALTLSLVVARAQISHIRQCLAQHQGYQPSG
jgi:hypothetical protein